MELLDDMKVKDIKRYHIEKLVSEIQIEGYICTSKSVLKMAKNIFDYGIENDIIYKNPCASIIVKYKKGERRPLTENEKEILDRAKLTLKENAFISLLRYTGIKKR